MITVLPNLVLTAPSNTFKIAWYMKCFITSTNVGKIGTLSQSDNRIQLSACHKKYKSILFIIMKSGTFHLVLNMRKLIFCSRLKLRHSRRPKIKICSCQGNQNKPFLMQMNWILTGQFSRQHYEGGLNAELMGPKLAMYGRNTSHTYQSYIIWYFLSKRLAIYLTTPFPKYELLFSYWL